MKSILSVAVFCLCSSAFAEAGRVDLKIVTTAGETTLSRQIIEAKDTLSFKVFPDGLQFNYGNSSYGSTMFLTKSQGHTCATNVSSYGNNADYEVYFNAEDRSEAGFLSECSKLGYKVGVVPSRLVITVIDKKTGNASATVLETK